MIIYITSLGCFEMDYESTLIQMLGLKKQRITDYCTALLDDNGKRVGSIRE
jgi:hypothetical protein